MNDETVINTPQRKAINPAKLLQFRELGIFFTAVLVFIVAAVIEPRFLHYENLRSILLYIPLIVVVAMGEMIVIVSRSIDLSVGSTLGFSGIAVGMLFVKYPNFPIWLSFLLGTLIGAGLGAINGLLITRLKLPSIIVTLGTLSVYRGFVFIVSGGRQVDPNDIPVALIRLSQTSPFVIPWIVIFAAIIAVMAGLFIRFTHTGREIYAIGSNPQAAKLRGIEIDNVILLIFTISGACAGIAGVMYASRFGYVNPGMTGVGFEFIVISATIIGGTSVAGGSGSVPGTVIGCILLGVVNIALAVLGISAFWQQAMYGFIIIAALLIDKMIQTQIMSAIREGVEL
jgi:rhamnose transport system permease protein